jgi:hypothetical protein
MAASRTSLLAVLCLAAAGGAGAAYNDPGFVWMSGYGDGNASLVYGSAETGEDFLFSLICSNPDKATRMTVYVNMEGTRVGSPVAIAFQAGKAKLSVDANVSTDEMSGFHFAEAAGFKIKPVIELLKTKDAVKVTTGKVVSSLPEKGRAAELANFAKVCHLD